MTMIWPKARYSMSANEPGEVDEPQENAIELGETSSRKNSNQTISIWWIANNENINCKGGCYL